MGGEGGEGGEGGGGVVIFRLRVLNLTSPWNQLRVAQRLLKDSSHPSQDYPHPATSHRDLLSRPRPSLLSHPPLLSQP